MKEVRTLAELTALSSEERAQIYIAESLTMTCPVKENGEAVVAIEASRCLHSQPDEACYNGTIKVREQVFDRLQIAAKDIYEQSNRHYCLLVVDGYRPYSVQRRYFEEVQKEIRVRLGSEASEEDVWFETTKWVADPDGLPPHSTGGAIDCTLCDKSGAPVDMGSHWSGSDEHLHPTWSTAIDSSHRERRMCLYEAMIRAGFINLPTEWWHYSYGDQYWALVSGAPSALYGRVSETRVL